jgi:hypothetical protein
LISDSIFNFFLIDIFKLTLWHIISTARIFAFNGLNTNDTSGV